MPLFPPPAGFAAPSGGFPALVWLCLFSRTGPATALAIKNEVMNEVMNDFMFRCRSEKSELMSSVAALENPLKRRVGRYTKYAPKYLYLHTPSSRSAHGVRMRTRRPMVSKLPHQHRPVSCGQMEPCQRCWLIQLAGSLNFSVNFLQKRGRV